MLGVQTVTRQWLGTCMVVMWMLLVSGCAAKLSAPRVGMDSLLVNLPNVFWDPSRPDFDTPRLAMRVQDTLQPSFIQPETPPTALHRGDFSESGPSPQLGRPRLVDPSNGLRSENERVDTASSAGRSRENVTRPQKRSLVSTLRFAVPSDTTWSFGFILSHGSSSRPHEVVEEQQLVDHSLEASRDGHISDPDTLARHNPFRGKKLSAKSPLGIWPALRQALRDESAFRPSEEEDARSSQISDTQVSSVDSTDTPPSPTTETVVVPLSPLQDQNLVRDKDRLPAKRASETVSQNDRTLTSPAKAVTPSVLMTQQIDDLLATSENQRLELQDEVVVEVVTPDRERFPGKPIWADRSRAPVNVDGLAELHEVSHYLPSVGASTSQQDDSPHARSGTSLLKPVGELFR